MDPCWQLPYIINKPIIPDDSGLRISLQTPGCEQPALFNPYIYISAHNIYWDIVMATGVEVVGLTLALFPLVIEGVGFYMSSAENVKEMIRHKRTLGEFLRDIGIEKSVFDNIWCILMTRTGVHIEPNMEITPEILKEVLSCLPQTSINSFLDSCQQLCIMLGDLEARFQKYKQDIVGVVTLLRGCIANLVNKAGYRKMYTMLKHFKKKDREQYIERIHRLNDNLHKLVVGAPQTTVEVNKHRKGVAGHFQQVRKHAITLYGALKEKLQSSTCHCTVCNIHLLTFLTITLLTTSL